MALPRPLPPPVMKTRLSETEKTEGVSRFESEAMMLEGYEMEIDGRVLWAEVELVSGGGPIRVHRAGVTHVTSCHGWL
jgi:hypothetical protein